MHMRRHVRIAVIVVTVVFMVVAWLCWTFSTNTRAHTDNPATVGSDTSAGVVSSPAINEAEPISDTSITSVNRENLGIELEPGFFAAPWKGKIADYEDLIATKVTEVPEPEEYTLQLKPISGQRYRYVAVMASSFASSADKPFMQMVHHTTLSTKLDNAGHLLVELEQDKPWALGAGSDMPTSPGSKKSLEAIVHDGDLYRVRSNGGGVEDRSLSFAAEDIEDQFIDFPKAIEHLRLGSSWTQERQGPAPSKVTYKIAGFADIGGITTAKIVTENRISLSGDIQQAVIGAANKGIAEISDMGDSRGLANIKKVMQSKVGEQATQNELVEHATIYVDITTGIVVRREVTVVAGSGPYQTTTRQVSQRVP